LRELHCAIYLLYCQQLYTNYGAKMASQDSTVITELHLRTIEQYMAEQAKSLSELTAAVNRLVARDERRDEIDKRIESEIVELKAFKSMAEPVVVQATKDQAFWSGFKKQLFYGVTTAIIISVLIFSGKLVYDNAGKNNQQQTQKVGK